MLFQTKDIIGFNDATKIIDSIYYFVWYSANFNSVKYSRQPLNEVMNNLVDNVVNSPFRDLCNYCDSKGGVNKTEFIFLFEKLLSYIYKDFNENPYICEYYLNTPEETANCKTLDFLGEGKKKLDTFKQILERIRRSERMQNKLFNESLTTRFNTLERNIKSKSNSFYDSYLDLLEATIKYFLDENNITYDDSRTCGYLVRKSQLKTS